MKSKIVRSDGPIAAPVDDELVIADIDSGKYYGFNDIATAIWMNLETEIAVEDLYKRLCESYEVDPARCAAEVLAFLKDLEIRRLIIVR